MKDNVNECRLRLFLTYLKTSKPKRKAAIKAIKIIWQRIKKVDDSLRVMSNKASLNSTFKNHPITDETAEIILNTIIEKKNTYQQLIDEGKMELPYYDNIEVIEETKAKKVTKKSPNKTKPQKIKPMSQGDLNLNKRLYEEKALSESEMKRYEYSLRLLKERG